MRVRTQKFAWQAVAAVCFVTGLLCIAFNFLYPPRVDVSKPSAPKPATVAATMLTAQDFGKFAGLKLQGPLVDPVVESSEPERTVATPEVSLPPTIQLTQILYSGNESSRAVFSVGNRTIRCKAGDTVEEATLKSIQRDEVVLTFREKEFTLKTH